MTPRASRFPAAALLVAAAVLATSGIARAIPPPAVPADVAAAFAGDALRAAQASSEGTGADFAGARADDIHEVFWFTDDFTAGRPTTAPVRSSGSWLAGLTRGGAFLGTLLVSKRAGAPAQWAGASADDALGTALGTLTDAEILVEDQPNGTYYALDGSTVRPLNDWARKAIARPTTISGLQTIVARQYVLLRSQPAEPGTPPWFAISLVSMGVALAVAGALALLLRRRRRSPSLP